MISVFERKWQSLQSFQRTRGILRLLALWVSRAHTDGYTKATAEPLIQLGSAPLEDRTFCDALFEQLGNDKLRVPVTTDIAGKTDSHAERLDREASDAIKQERLHRKVASAIFFESNGGQSQSKAEATVPEIKAAIGGPEVNLADLDTVLEGLNSTCFYLTSERNRYRFGLRANLNQMLVNSRGNIKDRAISARLKEEVEKLFREGAKYPWGSVDRKYFPTRSNDVPDRPQLTLVVLDFDHVAGDSGTADLVEGIVRNAGAGGRTNKSGLIFVAPDSASAAEDAARNLLAWEDIDADDDQKKGLDEAQVRSLAASLKRAEKDLREAIFRSYRHVFFLGKENTVEGRDLGRITSSSVDGGKIADLVIQEMSTIEEIAADGVGPSQLTRFWPPALTEWSTKAVRDAFFSTPKLPRLLNPESIRVTIADGVSRGTFGYARRKPGGGLEGLVFRKPLSENEVEIGDDVVIVRAEDAQKLLEPPKLTRLTLSPSTVEVAPGAQVGFTAAGFDQYGEKFATPNLVWKAAGGTLSADGIFVAGETEGVFAIAIEAEGVDGRALVQIKARSGAALDGGGRSAGGSGAGEAVRWTGAVPAQRWMQFYNRVLTRFANTPGLRIEISFEVPVDQDAAKGKVEETRSALKELGLDDSGLR